MDWREKLLALLGAATPFALASSDAIASPSIDGSQINARKIDRDQWFYVDPADHQKYIQLIGHRSHSSHSSHRSHYSGGGGGGGHSSHTSHTSHYSGSGGGGGYHSSHYSGTYSPPSPASSSRPSRFTPAQTSDIVRRVQVALVVRGYNPGPVDGRMGRKTRTALRQFQSAQRIAVTGTITPEVIRALGVTP